MSNFRFLVGPYSKAIVAAVTPVVLNAIAELGDAAQSWLAALVTSAATSVAVYAKAND